MLFRSLGNEWQRVAVLNRPRVYWLIVLHRPEFSILLFYEEEGGGIWTLQGVNSSPGCVLLYEFQQFLLFGLG